MIATHRKLAVLIAIFVSMAATYWWQFETGVDDAVRRPQSYALDATLQADERPDELSGVGEVAARSSATAQDRLRSQEKQSQTVSRSESSGETNVGSPDAEAQSWLDAAFSSQWSEQWSNFCADRPTLTKPCRPLKEMAVRFSRPNAPREDYWATFVTEELVSLAKQIESSPTVSWYRINCNVAGCILAAAGTKQDRVPMGADVQSLIRRQPWARDFEEVIFAGCISCQRVDTYVIVMPRRKMDSGTN